jgi:hypothetical protein
VARKQFDYDWTKIPEVQMYGYTKEEEDFWPFQNLHPKWNIPEKIAIPEAEPLSPRDRSRHHHGVGR